MPSKSKKQQQATAIALHRPEKLYKRNRGLAKMSKGDLRDFAETKHKGLPEKKGKKKLRVKNTPTGSLKKIRFKEK